MICSGYLYVNSTSLDKKNTNYSPLVSVLIPAWNEEIGITKTLNSLIANTYTNLEIIVIDDGSTDNTYSVVEQFKLQNPAVANKIQLFTKVNGGKSSALNLGIEKSIGEIVVTVDADSYLEPNAIKHLVAGLSDDKYGAATGRIVVGNKQSFWGMIQYLEYVFGFHTKKGQSIFNSIYILPGALTAIRKHHLVEIGGYEDYSKTEDFDLSIKLLAHKVLITHVDQAVCITEGASDLPGLINQRTRWRYGFLQCLIYRKSFIFNLQKGKYLSFVEFPFALLGTVDILFFPIFMFALWGQLLINFDWGLFLLSYSILPIAYLTLLNGSSFKSLKETIFVALIPILFTTVNIVEFIALIKSIYMLLSRRELNWTRWNRVGLQ